MLGIDKDAEQDAEIAEITPYEVLQKLIEHGHRKVDVLDSYSVPEIKLFYEKIIAAEMAEQANYIESVFVAINGAFGGYKSIAPMIALLRAGGAGNGSK